MKSPRLSLTFYYHLLHLPCSSAPPYLHPFVPGGCFNSVPVDLSVSSSFCRARTHLSSLFNLSFSFWRTGRDAISVFNLLFSFSTSSHCRRSVAPSAACPLATFSSSFCACLRKKTSLWDCDSETCLYALTYNHVYTVCTRRGEIKWKKGVTPEIGLGAQKSAGSLQPTYLAALYCQHLLEVEEPLD